VIVTRKFSIAFDCADPDLQAHFWSDALGYAIEVPPDGFESWKAYWTSIGVPEEELDDGSDSVVDPEGLGPRIWFQKVPEGKVVKNRVHFDLHVSGGRTMPMEIRKERVNAEAERLVRIGATKLRVLEEPGLDHYAMAMQDPEGNEFDLN
jgi:Glyoxalase-like domain